MVFLAAYFQTIAQNTNSNKGNCGCNYMPLCNYDLTRSYGGKVYKGIRNDDESINYYNCENGILTRKFSVTIYHTSHDEYYTYNFTRILLKENEKPGVVWMEDARNIDGRVYRRYILSKHAELVIQGKLYKDVIIVRQIAQRGSDFADGEEATLKIINQYGTVYSDRFYYGGKRLEVYDNYYVRNVGNVYGENKTEYYIDSLNKIYNKPAPVKQAKEVTPSAPVPLSRGQIVLEVKRQYDSIQNRLVSQGELDPSLVGLWFCKIPFLDRSNNKSTHHLSFLRFHPNGMYEWNYHLRYGKNPEVTEKGIWKVINGKVYLLEPFSKHEYNSNFIKAPDGGELTSVKQIRISADDMFPLEIRQENGKTVSNLNLSPRDVNSGMSFQKITDEEYKKIW